MLENKLGISDNITLAHEEERISKLKAIDLWDSGEINKIEPGKFDGLCKIHNKLFGDIYDFAGKIRTADISKGNFRFASLLYIDEAIKNVEKMSQKTFEEIIDKYIEMNIIHPFREGNGRSTRIWLDIILKHELNQVVDWSKIDKQEYLNAMERSPICNAELLRLLENALVKDTESRSVFMKGLDKSYEYEGYNKYQAEKLKPTPNKDRGKGKQRVESKEEKPCKTAGRKDKIK